MSLSHVSPHRLESLPNPEVTKACASYLNELLTLAPPAGVAVVLLDDDQTTSRVVFSWQAGESDHEDQQRKTQPDNGARPQEIGASCLTLTGSAGVMGAVLIRFPASGQPTDMEMFQDATQRLTRSLEDNILRQRLERADREAQALNRISVRAASGAGLEETYKCVIDELEGLVDFHRISFFLLDQNSGEFECAFQADGGGQSISADGQRSLGKTECDVLMSEPRSEIVDDFRASDEDMWPELFHESGFRSAIIAPFVHEGDVLGVAVIRNSYPKAFGLADESLLARAADLPIPAIIRPARYQSAELDSHEWRREIANIVAVGRSIEDMLELFASAAGEFIHFDCMTVAWLDRNGYDIHTSRSKAKHSPGRKAPQGEAPVSIRARLQFDGTYLGTLTLSRSGGRAFEPQDLKTLDLLATHISVAVENDRLSRHKHSQHPESLADLAHALRTPLSSIKGYSSSLLQPGLSWIPEIHREFLVTIDREADQLSRVIDDLLVAVDGAVSKLPLERSVTNVDTLLRLAEAKLLTTDGWHRVARFRPLPSQALALVDQTRITQVLVYFVQCAASSTYRETEILVSALHHGDRIEVSIGVQEQESGQYANTETSQDSPDDPIDDALRLSACRKVLEAHGADLEIGEAGEPEKMFSFSLPIYAAN